MKDLTKEIGKILDVRQTIENKTAVERDADAAAVRSFFETVVRGAFEEFSAALKAHGRTVAITIGGTSASFIAKSGDREELNFSVKHQHRRVVAPVMELTDPSTGRRFRATGYFRSGLQDYGVDELSKEEIVAHMLEEYRRHVSSRDGRRTNP